MKFTSYSPTEVDYKELAAFIAANRAAEFESRGLTLEELAERLENVWPFIGFVLARQAGDLTGYALLFQIGDSDLIEINPGGLLGCHPFAAEGVDQDEACSGLIEAAKEYIMQEGFNTLYIDIPWDAAAPTGTYDAFRERYQRSGFEVIQLVHAMDISLPVEVEESEISEGVTLAQIRTTDEAALYECHHQAYLQGDAQYYFQMDDKERKDDFKRIYSERVQKHPASLVLTEEGNVAGYVMLFAEGDFTEVMSLAVHPDYRRKGYGRLLMNECLRRAGENGHARTHLIVDQKNVKAYSLYKQCGFLDTGGNMTFKWKA